MSETKLTRRQALKALLAAGGGLTAAAFVPSNWVKPLVSAGVLPIHAAASINPLGGSYTLTASADKTSGEPNHDGLTQYTIASIQGQIHSTGGLPIINIPVTLTIQQLTTPGGYSLTVTPGITETKNTNASGIAIFTDLVIYSCGTPWTYQLNFNAVKAPYTISQAVLGTYTLNLPGIAC